MLDASWESWRKAIHAHFRQKLDLWGLFSVASKSSTPHKYSMAPLSMDVCTRLRRSGLLIDGSFHLECSGSMFKQSCTHCSVCLSVAYLRSCSSSFVLINGSSSRLTPLVFRSFSESPRHPWSGLAKQMQSIQNTRVNGPLRTYKKLQRRT